MERTLERLAATGGLDDRRFALGYARYRAGARRLGRHRLTRELRQRGVPEELIQEALAEVFPTEQEEAHLVRERIEKRFRLLRPPYPTRKLQSIYASLLRAGFSSAIIREELFKRTRRRVDDLADENDRL